MKATEPAREANVLEQLSQSKVSWLLPLGLDPWKVVASLDIEALQSTQSVTR